MDKLVIEGGVRLEGDVQVSGAKNAALPIICASILNPSSLVLENVPALSDTKFLKNLLEELGSEISVNGSEWNIDNSKINSYEAPYEIVRKMRASTLVMGPLLARFGEAKVNLPGGCAIGTRPIDIHLSGFEAMGAEIELKQGTIIAKAKELKGCHYKLRFPSVGATQNLLSAAVLAKGKTVLENVAREPEIVDLINFLNGMGAKVSGAGTSKLEIEGVSLKELKGSFHSVMGDRIEAITYLAALIITKGQGKVLGVSVDTYEAVFQKISQMGVKLNKLDNGCEVISVPENLFPVDIRTLPYPDFPTDAQAQLMALLTQAIGTSSVQETIFENRFMHVSELSRMGAQISIEGNTASILGKSDLEGAPVMASDLRASAALVLAGLVAKGQTEVLRIYHLDRGYENLEVKLQKLGAKIERVSE